MEFFQSIPGWRSGENSENVAADAESPGTNHRSDSIGGGRRDQNPSNAVANTIADREGVALEDLPPLYEAIDTDGLNAVLETAPDATVTFPYRGYEVMVTGRGEVEITQYEDD